MSDVIKVAESYLGYTEKGNAEVDDDEVEIW